MTTLTDLSRDELMHLLRRRIAEALEQRKVVVELHVQELEQLLDLAEGAPDSYPDSRRDPDE
jgi:hypothetical protein